MLREIVGDTLSALEAVLAEPRPDLAHREVGKVTYTGHGIAWVDGLASVQSEELLLFAGGATGMALNLEANRVGVVLLEGSDTVQAGQQVQRTGRMVDVPVGPGLVGRVVDPLGRALDARGPVPARDRRPAEGPAPAIVDRAPVSVPLSTGIKSVDALVPIGRGQRELIIGDRQTGKTSIALDAIINQKGKGVVCVYCAIGQSGSAVAKFVAELQAHGALDHTVVVVGSCSDLPGMQFTAPYAATTIAEYFMEQGQDALIVYDDLTRHARVYRELSLLLRRPPGREAYPGDIFYIHSRLLERSACLRSDRGGGSLTAIPIVETQAQNMSAYIPTNLISITDGQIYLSPDLFQKGILPAVDIGRSVSRVGGKAQAPAYRKVAGDLRLMYTQFEEVESFARFGTRLDEDTQRSIERGRRIREALKQPRLRPMAGADQVVVLLAATAGLLDAWSLDRVGEAVEAVAAHVRTVRAEVWREVEALRPLSDEGRGLLLDAAREALELLGEGGHRADGGDDPTQD